jgi:CRISPR system Cascade subunit CasE
MLRLDPDMRRVAAWGAVRELASPSAEPGYVWHALLAAVFGPLAPKPWRLVEPTRGAPHLLGYGGADRGTLAEQAALYADPAAATALALETLAVKRMPDTFRVGQKLGFEVRLRPVARSSLRLDGSGRGGREHRVEIDVAYQAALAAREADPDAPRPDADAVYKGWLADQLSKGGALADPSQMQVIWRRRANLARRDAGRRLRVIGKKGGGPDVALAGALVIDDPHAFATSLARGIGRHRAFGFGMLLLRPV